MNNFLIDTFCPWLQAPLFNLLRLLFRVELKNIAKLCKVERSRPDGLGNRSVFVNIFLSKRSSRRFGFSKEY